MKIKRYSLEVGTSEPNNKYERTMVAGAWLVERLHGELVFFDDIKDIPRWRKNCKETPVSKDKEFMGKDKYGGVFIGFYAGGRYYKDTTENINYTKDEITHWMEIPEVEE